ncbi:hypothetical protein IEQ34_019579 [Dendrobium chrysotoxum]|uniref:Uncharacterized protein n=1 Tax=Dendrobium chrysotoxum TaxID=161865 RepID=A0AAV7FRN6_DENCH|nr:hypothetical protein IEQ34_019579 [Dendrobium chrysotoxum]
MAAVRVLQEIRISPSPSLPSQPPQPLSFLDAMWLQNSQPVERLFFYNFPHPTSHFIDHNLPILTKSLTLRHFYPLAGSIRPSLDSDNRFEIVYEEGDSVSFILAEFTGNDFGNIAGRHPRNFKKLRLCIGFAINHAVCDGSGSMQFIQSWAAACRSTKPTLDDICPPFPDRSVIIDTHEIRRKMFEAMCQFKEILKKEGSLPFSDPKLVSATFTLNKNHIFQLKERVRTKQVEEGKPSYHLSSFVVSCAYAWRCLVKAREYDGDIRQCFGSPVDWRSRMRPPIPSNYFGNCLGTVLSELKAVQVLGKDGIEVAAMEIGKSIDGLAGMDLGETLEAGIDKYLELVGSRLLTIAGSPKFRVYEVNFGWGRPVKVETTSIVEIGAMSLAESREEGGIEIGLILYEEEMNKFGRNFATGLLDLCGRHECIAGEQPYISFLGKTNRHLSPFSAKHSSAMATVRVLHEIQISPYPTLPSQPPQPLSFLDTVWLLNSQPVERLFFYDFSHPTSHFIDHNLPIFTKSLSLALHHFYPLAGSIRPSPDSKDQFEIAYEEGDSITITVAEFIGDDFHNISGHHPRNFKNIRLLVPKLAKSTSSGQFPPISIQITLFSTQGICISFAINHTACDGSGSMQFIRSNCGLKERVKAEGAEEGKPSLHLSAFVVTCAYVWRCLVKAQAYDKDIKQSYFACAVDWRSRMRPPIPSNYFGNCLGACMTELNVTELVGKNGIEVAAMEIGKTIHGLQGMDVSEVLEVTINEYLELASSKALSVAGSPKLRVYEIDFGWGKPVKVDITSIFETGAISLAESREEDGGIEIGLVLSEEEMNKFEMNFANDLLDLWGRLINVDITSIFEMRTVSLVESRKEDGGVEIGLVIFSNSSKDRDFQFDLGVL